MPQSYDPYRPGYVPPAPAPSPVAVEASPVEAPSTPATPEGDPLDAELRRLVGQGLSLRGIAAALGGRLHKSGVAKRLRRLGLSTATSAALSTAPTVDTTPAAE